MSFFERIWQTQNEAYKYWTNILAKTNQERRSIVKIFVTTTDGISPVTLPMANKKLRKAFCAGLASLDNLQVHDLILIIHEDESEPQDIFLSLYVGSGDVSEREKWKYLVSFGDGGDIPLEVLKTRLYQSTTIPHIEAKIAEFGPLAYPRLYMTNGLFLRLRDKPFVSDSERSARRSGRLQNETPR